MRPTDIRLPGAVDLSALKRPQGEPRGPAASSAAGSLVVNVTEATFEAEVVMRSRQVPVVIDFWAEWCTPCKQLSPVLEKLVAADAGRWVLAKIDVDAEQRIAAAFQIQSIPAVLAVIAGQPVPLFQGALPEPQVRQVIDEVLRVAAANGVTGTVAAETPPAAAAPDPGYAAADDALRRGDLDAAAAAYQQILDRSPTDGRAKAGLARVEVARRVRGSDPQQVRQAAQERPDDVAAQCAAADADLVAGEVDAAFGRLLSLIRRTAADDREAARVHLVGLFEAVDPDDPRLAKARRDLAAALF